MVQWVLYSSCFYVVLTKQIPIFLSKTKKKGTSKQCVQHTFCSRCGGAKVPIEAHGLHRHVFGCQYYKKLKQGMKDGPFRYWSAVSKEVKKGTKKAGAVRCQSCCAMAMETETCAEPIGLPECWGKDKDPDPKLKRIRNALKEKAREEKERRK